MRKFIGGVLVVLICGFSGASCASVAHSNSAKTAFFGKRKKKGNRAGKKMKNGRYKKRRGLFGKKSGCGCPKN
ncbi:MAG: hypothetical protein ACI9V1_001405 [Spirosomataceae bacterium]|jgi:hypothetical protein